MSRDVIIHYDEAAGKIVCSVVEHEALVPLLAKALPMERSVEQFKARGPDEAERSLGAGVFALLDLSAKRKIGIRDYKAKTENWEVEYTAELQRRAGVGDAEALYEQALSLVAVGLKIKSKKKMKEADELLQKAVAGGSAEAAEYLTELWPALKARSDHFK